MSTFGSGHDLIISNDCNINTSSYSSLGYTYETPWDALKLYGCVCDIGYRGVDCSLLECPSSSDPRGGWGNESGINTPKHPE